MLVVLSTSFQHILVVLLKNEGSSLVGCDIG